MSVWRPRLKLGTENHTKEVFFVNVRHGVEENPDAPLCSTRCSWIRVHPSAEAGTHASLSHASYIQVRENALAFDLTGPQSIEMLERGLPLPDSKKLQCAHLVRNHHFFVCESPVCWCKAVSGTHCWSRLQKHEHSWFVEAVRWRSFNQHRWA